MVGHSMAMERVVAAHYSSPNAYVGLGAHVANAGLCGGRALPGWKASAASSAARLRRPPAVWGFDPLQFKPGGEYQHRRDRLLKRNGFSHHRAPLPWGFSPQATRLAWMPM